MAACRNACDAYSRPATVPGTPEARYPVMLSRVSLPLASRYMSCDADCGRALAEIDEGGAPIGQPHQHESAAADVARAGVRHGERKSHRNRGVDGVSARCENFQARLGGVSFARDHHAMARANGLRGPNRHGGRN